MNRRSLSKLFLNTAALATACVLSGAVSAAAPPCPSDGNIAVVFDVSKFTLAKTAEAVFLSSDQSGCPAASGCQKQGEGVIAAGTTVAVAPEMKETKGWVCVLVPSHPDAQHIASGYLRASQLKDRTTPPKAVDQLLGRWVSNRFSKGEIRFDAGGARGAVSATGRAVLPEGNQASTFRQMKVTQVKDGILWIGPSSGFSYATGKPVPGCLRMDIVGPLLIVNDEENCFGRATFHGVYQRANG